MEQPAESFWTYLSELICTFLIRYETPPRNDTNLWIINQNAAAAALNYVLLLTGVWDLLGQHAISNPQPSERGL